MDPVSLIQVHFEQLKELRNGTISYIQIIKRDQTRPPVRPVCRKLGVTKLSEIKSEADLYDALTSVASSQSSKSKDGDDYDSEPLSARPDISRLNNIEANSMKSFQPPYVANRPQQMPLANPFGGSTSPNVATAPVPRDVTSNLSVPFESIPEFNSLLECVLHIRVNWNPWDRIQRLDVFAYQFGLDEKFLLKSLKRICEILGCIHLSPDINVDLVVNSVKSYFRQIYQPNKVPTIPQYAPANMVSDQSISNKFGLQQNMKNANINTGRSIESPYTTPRSVETLSYATSGRDFNNSSMDMTPRMSGDNALYQNRLLNPNSKPFTSARSPSNISQFDPSPRGMNFINDDMSARMNYMKINDNKFSFPSARDQVNPNIGGNMNYNNQATNGSFKSPNIPSPNMIGMYNNNINNNINSSIIQSQSPNQRNIFSVYEVFWDDSLSLLRSIANPDVRCMDSVAMISGLNSLVVSSIHLSPALAVALDSVCSKAYRQLSTKVDKFSAESTPKQNLISYINSLDEIVNNPAFDSIEDIFTFSSESLLQNLIDQVNWCTSSNTKNEKVAEIEYNLISSYSNNGWLQSTDQTFYQFRNEIFLPDGLNDVVEHIKFRLQSMLDMNHKGIAVAEHGAAVIGLGDLGQTGMDLIVNLTDTELFEVECLNTKKDITRRILIIENSLKQELEYDTSIQHLQQCLVEQRANVKESIKSNPSQMGSIDNLTRIKALSKLTADSEMMCKVGDRLIESSLNELQIVRKQPSLKALLEQLKSLKLQLDEVTESIEIIRTQTLLNISCNFSQFGYSNVQIQKKFQDSVITFVDKDSPMKRMSCCVVLNKPLYYHTSQLVACYFRMDQTEKVKVFAGFVKRFVKEHQLNVELCPYAWNVMIIHFLLRFGYLANIQDSTSLPRTKVNDIDVTFTQGVPLARSCQEKLSRTSLFELLVRFFKYYAFDGDIFGNVFTLRGNGDVIPKSGFSSKVKAVQWRLSLEDPFETGIVENPNDLGATLSFKGQATVFKTMSMAYFALTGIAIHKLSDRLLNESIADLLCKDKLYSLAVKSGFITEVSFSFPNSFNKSRAQTLSRNDNIFNSFQNQSQFNAPMQSNDINDMITRASSAGRLEGDRILTPRYKSDHEALSNMKGFYNSSVASGTNTTITDLPMDNYYYPSNKGTLNSSDGFSSQKSFIFNNGSNASSAERESQSNKVPSINISGILHQQQSQDLSNYKNNNFNAVIQPKTNNAVNMSGGNSGSLEIFDQEDSYLNSAPPGLFNQLGGLGGLGLTHDSNNTIHALPIENVSSSLQIHDDDSYSIASSQSGTPKYTAWPNK